MRVALVKLDDLKEGFEREFWDRSFPGSAHYECGSCGSPAFVILGGGRLACLACHTRCDLGDAG